MKSAEIGSNRQTQNTSDERWQTAGGDAMCWDGTAIAFAIFRQYRSRRHKVIRFVGILNGEGAGLQARYAIFHAAEALKRPFSRLTRERRMKRFLREMDLKDGQRVIDLGGLSDFWHDVPVKLDITILNLPEATPPQPPRSHHRITLVAGDACQTGFEDGSFDIAFSNSVIEHVGGPDNQQAMAGEIRRLAPNYWVQTPSIWFPVEAHTNMPFWWFYPGPLKRRLIAGWERKLPAWCEMIKGTTVISRTDMAKMFPDGVIWTECFAGFPKSIIVARRR